jgi:undecaprenyl diphosphate synthase
MKTLPQHIAIIMDGNGRWAKKKLLPTKFGHQAGAKNVEKIVRLCKSYQIPYLTLYAFSSENWKRENQEISDLMDLFRHYLKNEVKKLIEEDIRILFIGDKSKLPLDIQELMRLAEEESQSKNFTLILAVNYGGRDEIQAAALRLAQKAIELGSESTLNIEDFLYTKPIPDPDLLIRTSPECRISNFLLWQIAYSELYFTNILWPDFNEDEFKKALEAYAQRERRYGGR